MKRKYYFLLFLFCILLLQIIGCSKEENKTEQPILNDEVPSLSEYKKIHGILESSFVYMDYDKIKAFKSEEKCIDNAMISDRIDRILRYNYDLVENQDSIIYDGNAVTVDCVIEDLSRQEIYTDDGIIVLVGAGFFDSSIESEIIGRKVGDTITIDAKRLENKFFSNSPGERVIVKIRKVGTYEDKEKKSNFLKEQGFSSFNDFYKYLYEMKVCELEYEYYSEQSACFFKMMVDNSRFDIVKEELENYSLQIIQDYEYEAQSFNMTLENYYEAVLQKGKSEFFIFCTEEAEFEIKKLLAIEELSKHFSIYVEPEDYAEFCETNNINENDETGRIDAGYYCLLDKVVRYFVDNNQGN